MEVDQWNRTEDPELKPHIYDQLIFDKGAETSLGKNSLFNKWCWLNWRSTCRRMRIDSLLSPCTKLNSKWIKDLHVKQDTLTLIEKKLGKTLEDIGSGGNFVNRTRIAFNYSQIVFVCRSMYLRIFQDKSSILSIILCNLQFYHTYIR